AAKTYQKKIFGSRVEIEGGNVGRRRAFDCDLFTWRKLGLKLLGNRLRDFTLDREDIGQIAVVGFRPEMRFGPRVDQLRVDAHAIARALNASFNHIRDSQLLRDVAQIACNAALILQNGGAADHLQVGNSGKASEDFILYAIGEIYVIRISAAVFERKDGNALVRHRVRRRILNPQSLKDEKCRHAEYDDGCDCESGARASHAPSLWGATLQLRCQLVRAGP